MTHYEDEKKGKLVKYIKDSIINIIVVGIALAYVFFQQVTLETQEINIAASIGQVALSLLCGIMIKQGLGENGFSKGYSSKVWTEELEKYNLACNTANDYMERVDNFYYCEEIEKRKKNRRAIMMGARLKYSDFFDEYEDFIGKDKIKDLTRQQKVAIERCVRIKIYNLNLFSEYSSASTSDTHREKTDGQQRIKMAGKNSASAILIAMVGAYFVPVINGWNWASFVMATLQVCMWCGSGIMQLYTNYNYVCVDKVNKLKAKKELIGKFVFGCKQGLYTENPYEVREQKKLKEEKAEIKLLNAPKNEDKPKVEEEHKEEHKEPQNALQQVEPATA